MDQAYGLDVDKPDFNQKLEQLRDVLEKHMKMEEEEMFPHIERSLSTEALDSLNKWFDQIKTVAPTRPHPDGPHSAVGKLTTGNLV